MAFNPQVAPLALPLGSLVLVTGATGYIATHIVTLLLASGYRVRGTARSPPKAAADTAYHANADYTCVVVPDMLAPDAFSTALAGVDGVIHVACPTAMVPDPDVMIAPLVSHITDFLASCKGVSTLKRVVYTSSANACTLPVPGRPGHIHAGTWNDEAVRLAWTAPRTEAMSYPIYAAAKTEAERALWRFIDEEKPGFVVNAVLPDTCFGRILNGKVGPTGFAVRDLYLKGEVPGYIPSQYMVNTTDVARLHLAALVDASLTNARILAFDEVFTWNSVIDEIARARPACRGRLEGYKSDVYELRDVTSVENEVGRELLEKWFGLNGWTGLARTVAENLEGVEAVE